MGRDEDGDVLAARQVDQDFPELVARHRIDARGRLVEDEDFRFVHNRNRQRQSLTDARAASLMPADRDNRQARTGGSVRRCGSLARLLGNVKQPRMQLQVLAHRQLGIERERLRHVADAIARAQIGGVDRLDPTGTPRPMSPASNPVSIFIVVVLPQPFGPRNPKISPRPIAKLTLSTAVKSPNRQVSSRAAMTVS